MRYVFLLFILSACGADSPPPDSIPAPDAAQAQPDAAVRPDAPVLTHDQLVELCLTTGATVCKQAMTCSVQIYELCYQDYEDNCPYIVRVRDYYELVNECLPWLATLDCEFVRSYDFRFIPACKLQFVVDRPVPGGKIKPSPRFSAPLDK